MEKIKKINKKKQLSKMPKSVTTNVTTATTDKTYAYYQWGEGVLKRERYRKFE